MICIWNASYGLLGEYLVHRCWWIWGTSRIFRRWSLTERSWLLEVCPWSYLFFLTSFWSLFLSVMRWGNPAKCSCHSELLPMCMGPSNLGLDLFKLRARLKLSSFTWLKSSILMAAIKAWQIIRPSIRKEYGSLNVFLSSTIIYCMSQGFWK